MGEVAKQHHASQPLSTALSDASIDAATDQMASAHSAPFLAADDGGTHFTSAMFLTWQVRGT